MLQFGRGLKSQVLTLLLMLVKYRVYNTNIKFRYKINFQEAKYRAS